MRRLGFALALLAGAVTWTWVLMEMATARPQTPAPVELPDLDDLEARLVRAKQITRRWEWLRERSERATEIACEQLADAAARREVW